jgi:hypothetical protein
VAGDGAVDFESLTPTQQLVLEVLAARHRLGHTTWTFTASDALTKAFKQLGELGLITHMGGVVEKTRRASLTETGKKLMLDPHYRPPSNGGRR